MFPQHCIYYVLFFVLVEVQLLSTSGSVDTSITNSYSAIEVIPNSISVQKIKLQYGSIQKWLGQGDWWGFGDSSKAGHMVLHNPRWKVEQISVNETIFLRKLDDTNVNPCYELKTTEFKSRRFCYPAIMITGYPKCGTSAIFDLIAHHPATKAVGARGKENCRRFVETDETGALSRWWYLKTLKKEFYTSKDKYLVDGCIYTQFNMKINSLLKNPRTVYIVIIRDYANFLWSYYNYWCKKGYDDNCGSGNWAIAGVHKRTPDLFHNILLQGNNATNPLPTIDPCKDSKTFFRTYLETLWKQIPKHMTIVVANELLETYPEEVWQRIALITGINQTHPNIEKFKKLRVNTQSNRGVNLREDKSAYNRGIYNTSGFKPMREDTRTMLNACWLEDCVWVSHLLGFAYAACKNDPRLANFTTLVEERAL